MGADFWDDLGRKLSGAADVVGKKTGEVAETVKLKNQIYALERENNKAFEQLGKKIYEQYLEKQEVGEPLERLCERIAQREVLMEQYQGELEELKEK